MNSSAFSFESPFLISLISLTGAYCKNISSRQPNGIFDHFGNKYKHKIAFNEGVTALKRFIFMPELVFFYCLGFLVSCSMSIALVLRSLRFFRSKELQFLQTNLAQIDSAWNESTGTICARKTHDPQKDRAQNLRHLIILSLFLCFLSWVGSVLLGLLWASLEKIARPALQKKIWQSDLVRKPLSATEVQSFIDDFSGHSQSEIL